MPNLSKSRATLSFALSLITTILISSASAKDPTPAPSTNPTTKPTARPLPAGVKAERNIEYVQDGGKSQSLDLYLPEKQDGPIPLIIWIHGGAWVGGDKSDTPAIPMVKRGYAVASLNYRLSHQSKFPAQIEDCKAAVRWLRANSKKYNLDDQHFGAWGESAGGHLVALLGTAAHLKEWETVGANPDVSSQVQAVCDFYGPTDFLQIAAQAGTMTLIDHNGTTSPEALLMGGPIAKNKEMAIQINPITHITKETPPFLVLHGQLDVIVPVGQSHLLKDALTKAGIPADLKVLGAAGHGGPPFHTAENIKLVNDFFDKHLHPNNADSSRK